MPSAMGEAVAMATHDASSSSRIVRLVGVYDADATFRGELTYWVGARLGRRHCSLCDITHGSFRVRSEWTECRTGMPVPFDTFHRNDQPPAIRSAAGGLAPVVIAETAERHVLLLTPADLETCDGSIELLMGAIENAVVQHSLSWTGT